jgi:pimeloyl-ACP methyl ester carboxylesterase
VHGSGRILALLLPCLSLGAGCALLGVKEQREVFEGLVRLRGQARLDVPSASPLVVVLARASDAPGAMSSSSGDATGFIVDHFPLDRAGSFAFLVAPGSYRLSAFADRNANLVYDPGEPALTSQPVFDLTPGGTLDGLELVIPHDRSLDRRYDILALQARTPKDQHNFSLGRFTVRGAVVDLHDEKFGPASGEMGMWRFADFLFEVGPGVYFLEAYDPKKIPVLFVHGIAGYPQQFASLIERMDRERFQPWLYFYPSGVHLDALSHHLTLVVTELQLRHGFDRLAVVAHSMGGLVARSFVLEYQQSSGRSDVEVFVAISSPWGGSESAAKIAEAPQDLMVYSWLDMDPASGFLRGLFYEPPDFRRPRPLPAQVQFHMIFGYKRDEGSRGPSGDGVLTVKSEARTEAVLAARSILPLDYDHAGILASDEAATRLDAILRDAFE